MKQSRKKGIIIAGIVLAAAAVSGIGIWKVLEHNQKAVKVAPAANMNQGGWYSESEVVNYGTVTTNFNQDIYYDETLTVTQVYVNPGDAVKIGDPLIAYDTTLAALELEMKQMQITGIALNIQNVQAELNQLWTEVSLAPSGQRPNDGTAVEIVRKGDRTLQDSGVQDQKASNDPGTQIMWEDVSESSSGEMILLTAETSGKKENASNQQAADGTAQLGNVKEPGETEGPGEAEGPGNTEKPGEAEEPGNTEKPGEAEEPGNTEKPGNTEEPGNTEKPGEAEEPGNTEKPGEAEEPERPAIGTAFPKELLGKTIYQSITIDAEPYNEDADGSEEHPGHFLCAPGTTVDAAFMKAVLEHQAVCVFEVVDDAENPSWILYSWILDGRTGEIIQPEEPEEPEQPEETELPEVIDEPVPAGPTYEELQEEIQEKEQKLKELDLDRREAELELKKLQKKVDNGIVSSTVNGMVKTVLDEETARMEGVPVISVTGEQGFYVTGRVAETALDKLQEGMAATVTSWENGMSYEASVTGIGGSPVSGYYGGNENMSYYPFTVVIQGDAELSNGQGVELTIAGMSDSMSDELYLDQMFVREEGNQYYVYKKGENGYLTKQYVEVGKIIYGTLEIISGLSVEDEIAFPYGKDVKEGAKTESADTLYEYY